MGDLKIKPNCEYNKFAPRWQKVRDILDGEARLKQVDLGRVGTGFKPNSTASASNPFNVYYLRPLNPTDTSDYNQARNANYICGARLYNATVKTLSGLMGMVFRVEPVTPDLPTELKYLPDNVDGSGLDIEQQMQAVAGDVLSIGRGGLLTDMPRNDEGKALTQADVDNGFRPTIQEYKAESIIDWHESVINGAKKLDLLVLSECVERFVDDSCFQRETVQQLRVYRLDDSGVSVQVLINDEGELKEELFIPVMGANNEQLKEIPFAFVGSKNNQPGIDRLPLEPVTDINLGHYQESANLASSSFQLSACQPVIADDAYSRALRDPKNSGPQKLGEQSAIVLGSGGRYDLVSPPENNLSSGIQGSYEQQMIALGAQLITSGGGAETAEAARIKRASDVSDLEVATRNISAAYNKSLKFVCLFMGIEYNDKWTFELNTNFFESKMTPQEIAELVKTWQAGGISKAVLDYNLQAGKVIKADEDLEVMNDAIAEETASDVDFDDEANNEAVE